MVLACRHQPREASKEAQLCVDELLSPERTGYNLAIRPLVLALQQQQEQRGAARSTNLLIIEGLHEAFVLATERCPLHIRVKNKLPHLQKTFSGSFCVPYRLG